LGTLLGHILIATDLILQQWLTLRNPERREVALAVAVVAVAGKFLQNHPVKCKPQC